MKMLSNGLNCESALRYAYSNVNCKANAGDCNNNWYEYV